MIRPVPVVLLAACLTGIVGCRRPQITSYRVPKEKEPAMPAPAAANPAPTGGDMASTPVATASGPDLTWTAPAGWTTQTGSAMRKGSYLVEGPDGATGDMSITAFPGEAGGFLANVNRWRSQLSLPVLSQADADAAVTRIDVGTLQFDVVDFANAQLAPPQRVLGAITEFNGSTWFFKLSGPDSLIAGQKPAFMQLIESVRTP